MASAPVGKPDHVFPDGPEILVRLGVTSTSHNGTQPVRFFSLRLSAANPFLTPRGAEAKSSLAYNTVMRAIGQLEKLKVLKEVSEAKRDRVYCAKAILDILEEPARLTPGAVA